jgi:hypothetical protein
MIPLNICFHPAALNFPIGATRSFRHRGQGTTCLPAKSLQNFSKRRDLLIFSRRYIKLTIWAIALMLVARHVFAVFKTAARYRFAAKILFRSFS